MNLVPLRALGKSLLKPCTFYPARKVQLPSLHCNLVGKFRIALCVAETTCPNTFFLTLGLNYFVSPKMVYKNSIL